MDVGYTYFQNTHHLDDPELLDLVEMEIRELLNYTTKQNITTVFNISICILVFRFHIHLCIQFC